MFRQVVTPIAAGLGSLDDFNTVSQGARVPTASNRSGQKFQTARVLILAVGCLQAPVGRFQIPRSTISAICRSVTSRAYSAWSIGARSAYRFFG